MNKLRGIGGKDAAQQCRRCLKFIFTDQVAKNFSWCGAKNNLKIKDYLIIKILFRKSI